ncbi:putative signaling protein [Octadecabacter antarcticus 307]|uniref:Putative signaling protein n=1 Tax=Octadecabacter antarcticus 307 TaxID=391626 RepID=M9RGK1_9RHOB|nr:bifunctional diguanylate cyclase/phosphodiesterase [Octadecabacter antarcticus]AGI68930.1 putative signaling protein [Octadecabacter antarcticus 307]
MFNRIIASTRPHFADIAKLSVRDTELVFATGILMCTLCWHVGHPIAASVIAVTLLTNETLLRLMFSRKLWFASFGQSQTIGLALILHSINAAAYALPAVYLAGDPSFARKITGLMLAMGIQVYIANTWSTVPVFVYALLLPSIAILSLSFLQLATTQPVPSSMTHWAIAVGALFLFIYSAVDTLRQHLQTQLAMFAAQHDAAARLAELEDSLRLDTLTKLLNRPAFDRALNIMLEDRAAGTGEVAVFLVDLDSFKPINDTYSHAAGDQVLIETARRLQSRVGQMGIVGRLGGDEFVCAVQDLSGTDDAMEFARTLSALISRPIRWAQRQLKIGASIGVTMTGDGQSSPPANVPALCSAADQAMFMSKSSPNKGPILYQTHLFAPRMSPDDKQILVDSIANETILPFYQPKIHLPTGQIIGFEALARWNHPTLGTRGPSEFLDQINELGLQGDFMTSMATQVVRDIETLLGRGYDPGQVSLNLSEVTLATHSGRQDLHRIIAANPTAAQHLTLEITEDVFIARAADAIQASIASFHDLGVRISLDDFGTGFASFHHLRQLDFDELKIDTSFVAGLGHDSTSEVLVRGFLNIASGLGVSVIAEGVETDAQSQDLINMGCVVAQGYLFSPAVPFAQATDLLTDQKTA